MSDSLSPSGSDLIMDDGDLNNMSAEAKCGLIPGGDEKETRGRITFVSKLSAPDSQTAFKFGSPVRGLVSNNPVGSKISVADPRTKYKPSGFLSLEKSNDVAPIKEKPNRDRKMDHLDIKRTVQNSFGTSSFREGQAAVSTPGHALTRRYGEKMTKHGEGCTRAGMVFLPLPVETLGGWHDQTVSLVKRLGSALARQTGQEESEAIRHLAQRLSVLLAKGNAALLLNRVPTFPSPDIDGLE